MKSLCKLLILLLFIFSTLAAQNQMQVMQTYVGDYGNAYLGDRLVATDFNGDGFDDLFMNQWSNGTDMPSKVFGYFGGTVLDTIPDLMRQSLYTGQAPGNYLISAGDINGDGYDDLMDIEGIEGTFLQSILRIFYGGATPDLIPDYETIVNHDVMGNPVIYPLQCIGDINYDGCDDIGVILRNDESSSIGILLGGSYQVITVVNDVSTQMINNITRLGDVNGDGIDDFMVGYAENSYPDPPFPRYRYVYYGNDGFLDFNNRVLIPDSDDVYILGWIGGLSVGDFNGDGYDDFTLDEPNDQGVWGKAIKLGSESLPESQVLMVDNGYQGQMMNYRRYTVAHGDFNGDGYSDIVGTNFEAHTNAGHAGIWIGRATANGLYDLHITPPATSFSHQFGWAVATGDFNNDGYCDVAFSAPNSESGSDWYPGYVYVYAGNADLQDTTVSNEDDNLVNADQLKLIIYPNPALSRKVKLDYKIEGSMPESLIGASIAIYNVKGESVKRTDLRADSLRNGSGSLTLENLCPGIYIAAINSQGKRLSTTKFTIK